MARNYPANTQIQKFLEESYNKERDTRLQWFYKRKDGNEELASSKQSEAARRKIQQAPKPAEDIFKKLPKDYNPPKYNKKKSDFNAVMDDGERILQQLTAEMRPPSPRTKETLYEGFTKEGKGRYQYLGARNRRKPEDKYSFPVLSSWDYGWRLGEVIRKDEIKKPAFGRTRIVSDTFYTRTGIPECPSVKV